MTGDKGLVITALGREDDFVENIYLLVGSAAGLLVLVVHLVFSKVEETVRLPIVLIIGWIFGYLIRTYIFVHVGESTFTGDFPKMMIVLCLAPIFYFATLRVDYHTFARSMGQILAVSIPVFFVHCTLVTIVVYPILNVKRSMDLGTVLVIFLCLSAVQVDSSITQLRKVHGQLRQLHLLLQGEKVVSVVLLAITHPMVFKYIHPNNISEPPAIHMIAFIGWGILSGIPALILGLLFRYLLNLAYNDIVAQAILTLACISLAFWSAEFIGSTAPVGLVAFGIMVGCSKAQYSSEAEKFFELFWDIFEFVLNNMLMLWAGLLIGSNPWLKRASDLGIIIVCYGLMMIARTLALAIAGLLFITRSGWISWKHYIVFLWGVYRGSPSVAIAIFLYVVVHYSFMTEILLYVVGIVLITIFMNVVGLNPMLRALGMYDLTAPRIQNMDSAVVHVNHCREKAIMSLKMDRVIADANWLVVDQTTKLPHPYQRLLSSNVEDDEEKKKKARVIVCGECGAESIAPLTKKEINDIILEAKHRILKAQMMSFWRQSENGTVSAHGYRFLVNLVEMASVRDDPILTQKDLKIQRGGSPMLRKLKAVFGMLYTITATSYTFIPTNWFRGLCFRICMSRCAQIILACISIGDVGVMIHYLVSYYFGSYSPREMKTSIPLRIDQLVDYVCYAIFFIEFLVVILGIGVVQYFKSNVNKIEFVTGIVIRPIEIGFVIDTLARIPLDKEIDRAIIVGKTLLLLRVSRIYIFIVALIPKLLNVVDRKMDDDLIKVYDIGKAYIIALDKVIKFLGYIVDNEIVFNQLTDYMESERRNVTRELGLIQKDRPTIAVTLKTRHAVRHVINTMNDCIMDMKEEGMLDWNEHQTLKQTILQVKKRMRNLTLIPPSPPQAIIKEIPWLVGDKETISFLSDHAMLSSYAEGDVIIYYADEPVGLFIVVSGLVHSYYKPSDTTTYLAKTYGVLPNYDFFVNHLKLDTPQEEFIVGGGNVIGEIGIMTSRKYDCEIVCETSVQLYFIPWTIVRGAVHDSQNGPFLQAKIWKTIAMKIGVNLLPYTTRFQGWSREKLLLYLQRGVVPVLTDVTMINISTDVVEDVFLVEGVAMDMATRSVFLAPTMIPRTIQRLLLPDSYMWDYQTDFNTRLLIIPCANSYLEDIMGPEGIFKGNYTHEQEEENEPKETEEDENSDDGSDGSDEDEEDDDEEQEEEVTGVEDQTDEQKRMDKKACLLHAQQKAIAEMLLKRRRRRNRRITFLEYVPTMNGPLEGNPYTIMFISKTRRGREIRSALHSRSYEQSNIDPPLFYTQDIEEVSEIGSIKEENPDETSVTSSRSKLIYQRSKSKSFAGATSEHSLVEGLAQQFRAKTSDQPKQQAVLVIESDESDEDTFNSRATQTNLQQFEKRLKGRRFTRRITLSRNKLNDED